MFFLKLGMATNCIKKDTVTTAILVVAFMGLPLHFFWCFLELLTETLVMFSGITRLASYHAMPSTGEAAPNPMGMRCMRIAE